MIGNNPYSPKLLAWSKTPSHRGIGLTHPNLRGLAHNRNCGDKIFIKFLVTNDVIQHAEFDGESCAISQASSQALCEYLEGKHISNIYEVISVLRKIILEGSIGGVEGYLDDFRVLHPYPSRHKCALLIVDAIENALGHD